MCRRFVPTPSVVGLGLLSLAILAIVVACGPDPPGNPGPTLTPTSVPTATALIESPDGDGDGITDATDNCPFVFNPNQADGDLDGTGDWCDPSSIDGPVQVVPTPSPFQAVPTPTSTPPAPAADQDGDGIPDATDNCPSVFNPDQADLDGDTVGDACDVIPIPTAPPTEPPIVPDTDGDGWPDDRDNCPFKHNPDQSDRDDDGWGDVCDANPLELPTVGPDFSGDGGAAGETDGQMAPARAPSDATSTIPAAGGT